MSIVSFNHYLNARREADAGIARQRDLEMAAEQFEALFLQQILKQMRKASDVLGAGSPLRSRESETMREFYDEVLAESLASRRQTGIADMLVSQLSGGTSAADLEAAGATARAAELPQRPSMSASNPLANVWQRGVERLSQAWRAGTEQFQALVERVIQQESSGQVGAVSAKGARGLMQLMPDTAREMAAELGLDYDESRLTRDAAYNKRLGSAYLSKMLERYDQHPALALAAYNAGPARVDEWLQSNGDPRTGEIGVADWIERIPFRETRDYTWRILGDLPESIGADASARNEKTDTEFKSGDQPVALQERIPTTAPGGLHQSLSAAFAQPIRIERKELDS
ncbi:transglycosylase SLT domain-containing protein [Zestomonas thermotolerans]|uniref:lytic transglycosylase domain-containing protein n=1 Tax=Zestomonas thermotolerans TaxID=157784 RepID=UPI00048459E4|nr:transglycosylase SLT domain-containing protein [Pseudomonas thermotolerans]